MAKAIFIQEGKIINYVAEKEIAYGEIIPVGERIGVASEFIRSGSTGGVRLAGVYEMATAAETINFGDKLYWDESNGVVTKTVGSLTCVAGIAVSKKTSSGNGTVLCRIG